MPPGTYGFKATGKLSASDYTEVAIPPLRDAIERGEKVRFLFQIGPGFEGLQAGAVWQEIKADLGLGVRHLSAWERTAVVSDEQWLRHVTATFDWMLPGEMRLFALERAAGRKALAGQLEPARPAIRRACACARACRA